MIDLFQTTKRKATIMVLIDVSGSMEGDKIRSARRATSEFLRRLDPADEVGVLIFADQVLSLSPAAARRPGGGGGGATHRRPYGGR